jgi:CO/xanthine dehydrogenase Mo-binding subunit
LLEGQIEGGVAMGLEYALTGGLQFDQKTGRYLNATLTDYKLPCFSDMPEIKVITVESFEPTGPYGAKGVGEPAMVGIGPAIANAVYNALGFRIKELPITPDKVLEACTLLKLVEG